MAEGGYEFFNNSKGVKTVKQYHMTYGAGDAMEPFYYRILYSLRNNRNYKTVIKVMDYYNVSPNSQQFSYATSNLRQEISSASGLLGQIGQIVKGIVGMKKDYQRMQECLDYYKETGKTNELILKGLWADFVDAKTGPASLTQASQKLEFFVARDWFFKLNNSKEVEAMKPGDVPATVKNFLLRKFKEYETWKPRWKDRLEEMSKLIEQQIKASQESINLYKEWIQPLLRNVEALKLAPEELNPDLIKISGNIYSKVKIVAWGKVDAKVSDQPVFTYELPKTDEAKVKPFGERGQTLFKGKDCPLMPVLEIELTLRSGPQGYMQTLVDFYARVYDKKRFEEEYWGNWKRDLAEDWINNLLLKEKTEIMGKEDKKPAKKDEDFLTIMSKRFDEVIKKVQGKKSKLSVRKHGKLTPFKKANLAKAVGDEVAGDLPFIYFVTKKSFGMLAELIMYR